MTIEKTKSVEILQPQIADTTDNWVIRTVPIPANHLAIDTSKRVLKVGTGDLPFTKLPNHSHNEQYSPLTHGHYFGYGDKWLRTRPVLWLRSDLPNHPELVELNGQYLDDDRAAHLLDVYVSETRINPVATGMSTDLYAVTASSTSPVGLPYHVFGSTITVNNLVAAFDQWVTEHTGANTEEWVALEMKGSTLYALTAYSLVARCGTPVAPFLPSPSPRDWCVEISDDGTVWTVVDTITGEPVWNTNEQRSYLLKGPLKDTRYVRIRITKWHIPTAPGSIQELGLRRVAFFGRRAGGFALPNLPAMHSNFAWVIPIADIGIGMKHEEIGDIGETGNIAPLLPKNRTIADGKALRISDFDPLYGCYGQKYAPHIDTFATMNSTVGTTSQVAGILTLSIPDNTPLTSDIRLTFTTTAAIHPGTFTLTFVNTSCIGQTWTLSYKDAHDVWVPIWQQVGSNIKPIASKLITNTILSQEFQLTIRTWSAITATATSLELDMTGSEEGYFHVPELPSTGNVTPYVVTQVRTEDINSSVVLDMQQVIAELQKQLATAVKRLSDAEIEIQTLKQR